MLFLKDLAANNDRQWLKSVYLPIIVVDCITQVHDPDYRAALQDFTTFTEKLSEKITEVDELIPELPVKDVVSTTHTSLSIVLTNEIDLSYLPRYIPVHILL
jgi:hypothetical protein